MSVSVAADFPLVYKYSAAPGGSCELPSAVCCPVVDLRAGSGLLTNASCSH